MRLPDETNKFRTLIGATLSLLTLLVLLLFASYKLISLISLDEYKVQVRDMDDYYSSTANFTSKDGLAIAAAVLNLSTDQPQTIDPSIGELKIYLKTWGTGADSDVNVRFSEVETKTCEEGDLNNVEDAYPESGFYAMRNDSQKYIDQFGVSRLRCVKDRS